MNINSGPCPANIMFHIWQCLAVSFGQSFFLGKKNDPKQHHWPKRGSASNFQVCDRRAAATSHERGNALSSEEPAESLRPLQQEPDLRWVVLFILFDIGFRAYRVCWRGFLVGDLQIGRNQLFIDIYYMFISNPCIVSLGSCWCEIKRWLMKGPGNSWNGVCIFHHEPSDSDIWESVWYLKTGSPVRHSSSGNPSGVAVASLPSMAPLAPPWKLARLGGSRSPDALQQNETKPVCFKMLPGWVCRTYNFWNKYIEILQDDQQSYERQTDERSPLDILHGFFSSILVMLTHLNPSSCVCVFVCRWPKEQFCLTFSNIFWPRHLPQLWEN